MRIDINGDTVKKFQAITAGGRWYITITTGENRVQLDLHPLQLEALVDEINKTKEINKWIQDWTPNNKVVS